MVNLKGIWWFVSLVSILKSRVGAQCFTMALRCCRKFKERMSFVAISLEVLSVLFRRCRLSEFTLTEPLLSPRRRKTKQPVLSAWATAPKGLFRHPGCLFLDRHCTLWAFNVFQTKIFTGNYNLGQNRWEIWFVPSPPPPPPKSRMGKWRVLAFARLHPWFGGMGVCYSILFCPRL